MWTVFQKYHPGSAVLNSTGRPAMWKQSDMNIYTFVMALLAFLESHCGGNVSLRLFRKALIVEELLKNPTTTKEEDVQLWCNHCNFIIWAESYSIIDPSALWSCLHNPFFLDRNEDNEPSRIKKKSSEQKRKKTRGVEDKVCEDSRRTTQRRRKKGKREERRVKHSCIVTKPTGTQRTTVYQKLGSRCDKNETQASVITVQRGRGRMCYVIVIRQITERRKKNERGGGKATMTSDYG